MSDRPRLPCPSCSAPLVPATGRGRHDDDGNYLEHRDGCRCPWCEWTWSDEEEPVRCQCGALVGVEIDDESAYTVEVKS